MADRIRIADDAEAISQRIKELRGEKAPEVGHEAFDDIIAASPDFRCRLILPFNVYLYFPVSDWAKTLCPIPDWWSNAKYYSYVSAKLIYEYGPNIDVTGQYNGGATGWPLDYNQIVFLNAYLRGDSAWPHYNIIWGQRP